MELDHSACCNTICSCSGMTATPLQLLTEQVPHCSSATHVQGAKYHLVDAALLETVDSAGLPTVRS